MIKLTITAHILSIRKQTSFINGAKDVEQNNKSSKRKIVNMQEKSIDCTYLILKIKKDISYINNQNAIRKVEKNTTMNIKRNPKLLREYENMVKSIKRDRKSKRELKNTIRDLKSKKKGT